MSRGVYFNWIQWKRFITSQYLWFPHLLDSEGSVSVDLIIWSLTLYQVLFPGGGKRPNKQHPSKPTCLNLLRNKKVSIKLTQTSLSFLVRVMKHMTYVHGQAELLLLYLRLKLAPPVTESTGSLQPAHLAACPYGVQWLFFTGCLHPRERRKDGARLLIP